ncbi:MAG: RnfABCDGE type electron transport complex subunit C, partial [Planctomycetes bacterium]|nr:RnfABCDGE type electron transport complex subunit C [Planctomycetota bacterium]
MTTATELPTFRHGVHPEDYKELTRSRPIERMPFVAEYVVHLSQHLGAPSHPMVRKGERVQRGQVLAAADGFVSIPQHAPVAGTVKEIGFRAHPSGQLKPAVVIAADPFDSQRFAPERPIDWRRLDVRGFVAAVQASGMVGLGGAAFPTHVKFAVPEGKHCRYLMVNACECEPFLTADHRTMLERPDALFQGVRIARHFLGSERIYLGIETNKPDALDVLQAHRPADLEITFVPLQVKYPQGAEKMLIAAVLRREVPSGKLPLDIETLVSNVETMAFLGHYFATSQPLIER